MDDPILWALPFIGLVGGFLSGLLGLGGGVALLPLLTWVGRVPLKVATGTTLVQVMIAAATGLVAHYRGGMVDLTAGLVLGISGIAGGLVGSFPYDSLLIDGFNILRYPERLLFARCVIFLLYFEGD